MWNDAPRRSASPAAADLRSRRAVGVNPLFLPPSTRVPTSTTHRSSDLGARQKQGTNVPRSSMRAPLRGRGYESCPAATTIGLVPLYQPMTDGAVIDNLRHHRPRAGGALTDPLQPTPFLPPLRYNPLLSFTRSRESGDSLRVYHIGWDRRCRQIDSDRDAARLLRWPRP